MYSKKIQDLLNYQNKSEHHVQNIIVSEMLDYETVGKCFLENPLACGNLICKIMISTAMKIIQFERY